MNIVLIGENKVVEKYYKEIGLNIIGIALNYRLAIDLIKNNINEIDFIIMNFNNVINKDVLKYLNDNNINKKIVMNFCNNLVEQVNYFNYDLEIKISNILYSLGFSPKYIGYQYLKDILIKMKLNYSKCLECYYKELSIKYNKCKKDIESSIRYAIDLSLARGNLNEIHSIFSYMVNSDKLRPSNKEFIYTIYEILK